MSGRVICISKLDRQVMDTVLIVLHAISCFSAKAAHMSGIFCKPCAVGEIKIYHTHYEGYLHYPNINNPLHSYLKLPRIHQYIYILNEYLKKKLALPDYIRHIQTFCKATFPHHQLHRLQTFSSPPPHTHTHIDPIQVLDAI